MSGAAVEPTIGAILVSTVEAVVEFTVMPTVVPYDIF